MGNSRMPAVRFLVLIAAGFSGLFVVPDAVVGQIQIRGGIQLNVNPGGGELQSNPQAGFFLPNRQLTQSLLQARQLIERGDYTLGLPLLQQVIDRLEAEEDAFFAPDPEKPGYFVSLKAETQRLLQELPAAGRESYELQFGALAQREFEAAVRDSDVTRIESVVGRFFYTNAGLAATNRVGNQYLDQSEPLTAALHFRRLLASPRARAALDPTLSLKTAVAWGRAGMPENSIDVLIDLKQRTRGGMVSVRGRNWPFFDAREDSLEWLTRVLGDDPRFRRLAREAWTMFRGDPSRNAVSEPASPLGILDWKYRAIPMEIYELEPDKLEVLAEFEARLKSLSSTMFADLIRHPAAHPLVVGDRVIFRSIGNLKCVNGVTGELLWEASVPDTALDRLVEKTMEGALGASGRQLEVDLLLAQRAWRDGTAGMISSDGEQVFSVDDLGVVGPFGPAVRGVQIPISPQETNSLRAFDLQTGKFVWQVGGSRGEISLPFAGTFFLGSPLVLGGKLYVLAEVDGEIRLLVLAVRHTPNEAQQWTVVEEWSQLLIPPIADIQQTPLRRISGIMPSYADGVMVCPTTAGAVVGVDLGSRQLLWGYQYESNEVQSSVPGGVMVVQSHVSSASIVTPEDRGRWLDSAPTVAGDYILLTPRDSNELHCLRISDGSLMWRRPRGQGLYVACVTDGRVVIVGRSHVEAVSLVRGEPVWDEPSLVGSTCGRGYQAGEIYYLPLQSGEIASIELKTGRLLARSAIRGDFELGNLVAVQGRVVSQSVHEIVALRSLSEVERRLQSELTGQANPEAMIDSGELQLQLGNEQAGLAALRKALEIIPAGLQQPSVESGLDDSQLALRMSAERGRALLRETLMEGLRLDFNAYSGSVRELGNLIETADQQFRFRRVLAEGLQAAGQFKSAFAQYLELIVDTDEQQLVQLGQSHAIRGDRWVAPRVAEIFADADDGTRTAMELAVSQRIDDAVANNDVATLLALARTLGPFSSIDQIRWKLLEAEGDQLTEIQAVDQLQALTRSQQLTTAAAATRRLAQRYLETGLFENAEQLIRELETRWADVVAAGTRTGSEVAGELRQEPGYVRFADEREVWGDKPFSARIEPRSKAIAFSNPIPFEGDPGAFREWSFRLASSRTHVLAYDGDGKERWRFSLQAADTRYQQVLFGNHVRVHRHLLVFDMGSYFLVIDTLADAQSPRLLWKRNLTSARITTDEMRMRQVIVQGRAPMGRMLVNSNVTSESMIGPITDESVTYVAEDRVVSADLTTGNILWQRDGIATGTVILGDESTIALIEPGTTDATLLRSADGALIGTVTLPTLADRPWMAGKRALFRRTEEAQSAWFLVDVTSGATLYQVKLAADAVFTDWQDRWLCFVEPSGRFLVIDEQSQDVVLDQKIPAITELESIVVRQFGESLILLTNQKKKADQWFGAFPYTDQDSPVNGPVIAFDLKTGEQLWSGAIEDQRVDACQPLGLPILVMTVRRLEMSAVGNSSRIQQRFAADVLDLRNGKLVFERSGMSSMAPFQIDVSDPEKGLQVHFSRESLILGPSASTRN